MRLWALVGVDEVSCIEKGVTLKISSRKANTCSVFENNAGIAGVEFADKSYEEVWKWVSCGAWLCGDLHCANQPGRSQKDLGQKYKSNHSSITRLRHTRRQTDPSSSPDLADAASRAIPIHSILAPDQHRTVHRSPQSENRRVEISAVFQRHSRSASSF